MILSLLIVSPLIFATIIWIFPKSYTRFLALAFSLIEFLLSLSLLSDFDKSEVGLQFVEKYTWIKSFGISYFLGLDGISLWLVILSTLLVPIMILSSWKSVNKHIKGFHICLLILEAAMVGTFLAMDSILFYVFFEASLIPMYFIVGIWGGSRRLYASMKFFIYTMAGSVLMLVGIIALIFMTQNLGGGLSASLLDFYKLDIPFVAHKFLNIQNLLFFAFSIAFAIKVPIFPFHTWLPDAHVEAPTAGSVILAGIMLKMGAYGFLRFVLPLFPEASSHWAWLFFILAVLGIIYGALMAMVQPDIKKLVAYSSVSHMGYIIAGIFSMNVYGYAGGLYQMISHGVSTAALFLLVGIVYERTHSREISKYGGLASAAPKFSILFFIVILSSIAVPLTNSFVGEFLILLGIFEAQPIFASVAVTGVVLGASYMLWMFKKVFFGEESEMVKSSSNLDLNLREALMMSPLIVLIFWMGIFPNHFLSFSKTSINHLVENKYKYELYEASAPLTSRNKLQVPKKGANNGL